jgi:multicomponent Na+:H+ antiporter subunit D
MILTAAADGHYTIACLVLLFASAGVFHHSGIKIPFFAFFAHDRGHRVKEAPLNMLVAMAAAATLCLAIGIFPQVLYGVLPYPVDYVPYTADHVVTMLQLLLFSGLAFFLLLPQMKRTLTISLDVDWFYRKGGRDLAVAVTDWISRARVRGERGARQALDSWLARVLHLHGPTGGLARTWRTSSTATIIIVMLTVYLLISYL